MTQIVVDASIARQINETAGPITLVDPSGRTLGSVERPIYSPEQVAEGLNRLNQPGGWLTSEQVMDHMRKLSNKSSDARSPGVRRVLDEATKGK